MDYLILFKNCYFVYDYIYCVDLLAYKKNAAKETILSGKETEDVYIIHPNLEAKLSLQAQRAYLNRFDIDYF